METKENEIFGIISYFEYKDFIKNFKIKDLNIRDGNNSSLLTLALLHRKFETAHYLVDKGIELNIQNKFGQTEIHGLAWVSNIIIDLKLSEKILKKGGDVNIKDSHGNSALWYAAGNVKGKFYDLVKLFMNYGGDPNSINKYGKTPMDIAKQDGDKKLEEILKGKSVN